MTEEPTSLASSAVDPKQVYKMFVENAQSEHCMLLEDLAAESGPRDELIQISETTQPGEQAHPHDFAQYARWLIEVARIHRVTPDIACHLVENLMEHEQELLVRQVIYSYRLAEKSRRTEFVGKLLLRRQSEDVKLVNIMGECGLFSNDEGRTQLAKLDSRMNAEIASHIWKVAMHQVPVDASLRTIIDICFLLPLTLDSSYLINVISRLNRENGESIRPCAFAIIKFLIFRASKNISEINFIIELLSSCHLNPQIIWEVTPLILEHCDEKIVQNFKSRVGENQSHSEAFIRYVNITFARSHFPPDRLITLISILGSIVDLSFVATLPEVGLRLAHTVLTEIRRREPPSHQLADAVLVRLLNSNEVPLFAAHTLGEFISYAGPQTCMKIFESPCDFISKVPRYSRQWGILCELAKADPEQYLRRILICWTETSRTSHILLELNPSISREVKLSSSGHVTLKNHKFIKSYRDSSAEWMLIEELQPSLPTCASCKKHLQGNLFTDERRSFGSYYCYQCSEFLPIDYVSPVTCPVCMNNSDVHIITCKHAVCETCLAQLQASGSGTCPVCRMSLDEKETAQISLDDAIKRFLEERKC